MNNTLNLTGNSLSLVNDDDEDANSLFLKLSRCNQTFCQRTLREVKMLTRFEHENIIDLKDVICENQVDKLKVRQMR